MSAPSINGFNPQIYTGAPQQMDGAHNVDESNQVEDKALQEWMEGNVNEDVVVENLKDQKFEGPGELHQAEAKPGISRELANKIKTEHTRRSAFKDFFTSIGRAIMNACHSLKCCFMPKYKSDINTFVDKGAGPGFKHVMMVGVGQKLTEEEILEKAHNSTSLAVTEATLRQAAQKYERFEAEKTNPLSFPLQTIGQALGVKGPIVLKPFTVAKQNGGDPHTVPQSLKDLCPHGGKPSILDIKQDPSMQDCWFLSSISSFLHAQGPDYFEQMISFPPNQPENKEPFANVRLGHHMYKVPLGEIRGNNGNAQAVSHSAPWVQLLETAMQMHMMQLSLEHNTQIGSKGLGMNYHNAEIGLTALMGNSPGDTRANVSILNGSYVRPSDLKAMLDNHHPVVLGHNPTGDGISPGHAVALLDVDVDNGLMTVLDPYGHTTVVPTSDLKDFDVLEQSVDNQQERVDNPQPEPQADKVEQPENDKGSQEISGGMFGDAEVID